VVRHRGRCGLTQRELAERVGVHRRSLQEWETRVTHPSAERLEALIRVLLEADGLTRGHEEVEARALWATWQRDAQRTHVPFDPAWLERAERRQDWGEP
jgi:transcriptional regulator with XRE-family HTH domain